MDMPHILVGPEEKPKPSPVKEVYDNFRRRTFKYLLIITVLVVLFFIALIVGFTLTNRQTFQNRQLQTQQNPTPTLTTVPEDDSSIWKTYTNEEYGFQFKYPADLKLQISLNLINLQRLQKADEYSPEKYFSAEIIIYDNDPKVSVEDFALDKLCERQSLNEITDYRATKWIQECIITFSSSKTPYTIGNIEGVQVSYSPIPEYNMSQTFLITFIPQGSKIYLFKVMSNEEGHYYKTAVQTFTQILSTFKFLD